MDNVRVLIAAAGTGSRAGLSYPKTLFPIQGTPILVRIFGLLRELDHRPTVVVSPGGRETVSHCLEERGLAAHLVVQPEPRGMGDAVLRFRDSPAFRAAEHVLLIWGDIPLVQPQTVAALLQAHEAGRNDFSFVTRLVDAAYTRVRRDGTGAVTGVEETREAGGAAPQPGERDIGLFLFRKEPVFDLLPRELGGKFGRSTGEHGFLYLVRHLAVMGYRVQGLPVATELDLVSLNALKDVEAFI